MKRIVAALGLAGCLSANGPLDHAFSSAGDIPEITSLAVWQDDLVVRQQYFASTSMATPHDVRSVTKTVTSLLTGIAIDQGCVPSLDATIGTLLGSDAPTDPDKAAITVGDLLTMSSGFDWSESGAVGDYDPWAAAPNQVAFVLARPLVATPGSTFNYNSGALHLLSAIIANSCAPTADFAQQALFGPLGIATPPPWETDTQGIPNGAAGLQLTTPELGAIGQLILHEGEFNGARVVSPLYVEAATTAQIPTGDTMDSTPSYGYGIWLGQEGAGDAYNLAEGYGGQFIVIVPDSRIVVVATAAWENETAATAPTTYYDIYDLIVQQILPQLHTTT